MKNALLILIAVFAVSTVAKAHDIPMTFVCIDKINQKELTVYATKNADTKSVLSIRDLHAGTTETIHREITLLADATQIALWFKPTGHGGSLTAFEASMQNDKLIGHGLGLRQARCFYVGTEE